MLARLVGVGALLVSLAAARVAAGFPGLYVAKHDAQVGSRAAIVVLVRDGKRSVVTLQSDYRGPAQDFALVIPVPGALVGEARGIDRRLIDRLDRLTAPALIEQWERDPCEARAQVGQAVPRTQPEPRHDPPTYQHSAYSLMEPGAAESATIVEFLRARGYRLSQAMAAALQPYADQGMRFLIAEVDHAQVHFGADGQAVLTPLRFQFDSERATLPLKVGTVTAGGLQDLVVFTISAGRLEAANYPGETMPTTIGLRTEAREQVGPVHAALVDAVLARAPGAVITEYAGSPGDALTPVELAALGTEEAPGLANRRGSEVVITRLHARLGVDEIVQDLELREARPLVGGTVESPEAQVVEGSDEFVTRYVIRHPFAGAPGCEDPLHGVWQTTAPEGAVSEPRHVRAMSDVERGLPLAEVLAQDLPALGISARRRCGCASGEAAPGLLGLGLLALLRRRRRASEA